MKGGYDSLTGLGKKIPKSLLWPCSLSELWIFHNQGKNLALTLLG